MNKLKVVSILGCGWLGFPLASDLLGEGFSVKGSTTNPEKLRTLEQAGIVSFLVQLLPELHADKEGFFDTDALVVNIPPKGNPEKYFRQMEEIIEAVKRNKIPKIIFISSTSVYGDEGKAVDESALLNPESESGKALVATEKLFLECDNFKTTVIRLAGLVGPGRDPGRFFAGKIEVPNGKAPVNLIHLYDAVGIIKLVLRCDFSGEVFNACSPDHPSRREFYSAAAKKSGLAIPEFKDELLAWKEISGDKVEKMLGYQFKIDNWRAWLNS